MASTFTRLKLRVFHVAILSTSWGASGSSAGAAIAFKSCSKISPSFIFFGASEESEEWLSSVFIVGEVSSICLVRCLPSLSLVS